MEPHHLRTSKTGAHKIPSPPTPEITNSKKINQQWRRATGAMLSNDEAQQHGRKTEMAINPVTHSQERKPSHADLLSSYDPTGLLEFASGRSGDVVDLDEVKYSELLTLDRGLYRALSGGVDDPSPPPDAFTVSGFDSKKPKKQRITNRRETFSLHVKIIEGVNLNIEHLIDNKKDMPKAAKKYVKSAQLQANAVTAVTHDGIEFVGILFASKNRSKQLLWPVDYGSYASTLNEPLTRRRLRTFAPYPKGAPLPQCTASTIPDTACLDAAENTYVANVYAAQDEERAVLAEIQLVLDALEVARFNAYAASAALCGSASQDTPVEASFDPDKTYVCLYKDEAPPVIRSYIYYYSLFKNRLRDLRLATTLQIDAFFEERKNDRDKCCVQPPTPSPTEYPTSFPTRDLTSQTPTHVPSTVPTSASPTKVPSSSTLAHKIVSNSASSSIGHVTWDRNSFDLDDDEDDGLCGPNGRRVTVRFKETADGTSLESGDTVNLDMLFPGGARFGVSAAGTATTAPQQDGNVELQDGMIRDTSAYSVQGNVLMISRGFAPVGETKEEGPLVANEEGGTIHVFFDEPVQVESMKVIDIEMDGSYVLMKDATGIVLEDVAIPVGETEIMFLSGGPTFDVTFVEIILLESGGVDDLVFYVSCEHERER